MAVDNENSETGSAVPRQQPLACCYISKRRLISVSMRRTFKWTAQSVKVRRRRAAGERTAIPSDQPSSSMNMLLILTALADSQPECTPFISAPLTTGAGHGIEWVRNISDMLHSQGTCHDPDIRTHAHS